MVDKVVSALKEAWQVVADWQQRKLYKNADLIELADAIEYGGVEITITAGKISNIKTWRGVKPLVNN